MILSNSVYNIVLTCLEELISRFFVFKIVLIFQFTAYRFYCFAQIDVQHVRCSQLCGKSVEQSLDFAIVWLFIRREQLFHCLRCQNGLFRCPQRRRREADSSGNRRQIHSNAPPHAESADYPCKSAVSNKLRGVGHLSLYDEGHARTLPATAALRRDAAPPRRRGGGGRTGAARANGRRG